MTLENLSLTYVRELRKLYPEDEAISIKNLVFMFVMACDRLNLTVRKKELVSSEANKQLTKFLERLMKHEPVHYVLGETWFYGMKMKVNPSVLIPRRETEFLVDLIIREQKHKPNLHILDICTGSGCIAIALKKNLRPDHHWWGRSIAAPHALTSSAVATAQAVRGDGEMRCRIRCLLVDGIETSVRSFESVF